MEGEGGLYEKRDNDFSQKGKKWNLLKGGSLNLLGDTIFEKERKDWDDFHLIREV